MILPVSPLNYDIYDSNPEIIRGVRGATELLKQRDLMLLLGMAVLDIPGRDVQSTMDNARASLLEFFLHR